MSAVPVEKMRDPGSERGVLATILRHGTEALAEAEAILTPQDFGVPINRILYTTIKHMDADEQTESFDSEAIKVHARSLGFNSEMDNSENIEYVELLPEASFKVDNISTFAVQIKKFALCRELYSRNLDVNRYLESSASDDETSQIIASCEQIVLDYLDGVDETQSCETLALGIVDRVNYLLENDPVHQVGLPTGFPLWDSLIGGGPRRGTVNLVVARPKSGKSFYACNISRNMARNGIKVLYLDTELTKEYQQSRLVCIDSGCPLTMYETGRFQTNDAYRDAVVQSANNLENTEAFPLYYQNVSGMNITQTLSVMRRWVRRHVGFNDEGVANDCIIVYDYLKLTSGDKLTGSTPEWILLGLMMTDLHNFCVKYGLPMIVFGQTNRDGIEREDSGIVAGSDRLLWLCSNMTVLKNKDRSDDALGCGREFGNKKLIIVDTRHGPGLSDAQDYINLVASLKPGVSPNEANGRIREGLTLGQLQATGEIGFDDEEETG